MIAHIIAGLLLTGMTSAASVAQVQSDMTSQAAGHRVVIHVNSADEKVQRGVLNNIRHLYQELGREQVTVELVVHGAGLNLLTKATTTLGKELATLKAEYGVHYTACSNTMKAMQLSRSDLIDEVGDTVSAVVRLMERQEQGWAYIKP